MIQGRFMHAPRLFSIMVLFGWFVSVGCVRMSLGVVRFHGGQLNLDFLLVLCQYGSFQK